jgi:intracellular septation protein
MASELLNSPTPTIEAPAEASRPQKRAPHSGLRSMADFVPLAAFFAGYHFGDILTATVAMVTATALTLAFIYLRERRIALLPLISGLCVLVFGGLTVILNDELFIKLRPTIVNCLFAATLLIGAYGFRAGLLKHVFAFAFELSERGWLTLSKRWGFFFLSLALINECAWRNLETNDWVTFKVFGFTGLTLLFSLTQLPLITRETEPD